MEAPSNRLLFGLIANWWPRGQIPADTMKPHRFICVLTAQSTKTGTDHGSRRSVSLLRSHQLDKQAAFVRKGNGCRNHELDSTTPSWALGDDSQSISPYILGDPGAVSRAGRKGATKVFKHRRKSPWVPTLTGPFPKGQANAGSWLGTKKALYYFAQSANSFSWVLFVSSYTTAIISPQLPGSFTKLS